LKERTFLGVILTATHTREKGGKEKRGIYQKRKQLRTMRGKAGEMTSRNKLTLQGGIMRKTVGVRYGALERWGR